MVFLERKELGLNLFYINLPCFGKIVYSLVYGTETLKTIIYVAYKAYKTLTVKTSIRV